MSQQTSYTRYMEEAVAAIEKAISRLRPWAKWVNTAFLLSNIYIIASTIVVASQVNLDIFSYVTQDLGSLTGPQNTDPDLCPERSTTVGQNLYLTAYLLYNSCTGEHYLALRPSWLIIAFFMVQPVLIRILLPPLETRQLGEEEDPLYPTQNVQDYDEDREILSNLAYSLYLILFTALMTVFYVFNTSEELGSFSMPGYWIYQILVPATFYFALMFTRYPSRLWLIPLFFAYYVQLFSNITS